METETIPLSTLLRDMREALFDGDFARLDSCVAQAEQLTNDVSKLSLSEKALAQIAMSLNRNAELLSAAKDGVTGAIQHIDEAQKVAHGLGGYDKNGRSISQTAEHRLMRKTI